MATKLATIIADFTTSLATSMGVGATTVSLQSATDDDGVALPSGTYFFALDGNNSQKEHIVATLSGTSLTDISSVSRQGAQTSGTARSHRVGATVTLTDFASLRYHNDLLTGVTDLDHSNPLKYDGTAGITDAAHIATKAYVDDVVIAGGVDASSTSKGITKLSIDPVSGTNPIAVGDNDPRVPTSSQISALAGTSGTTPSGSNKFVDAADVSNAAASGKIVRASGTALPALDGSALTGVSVTKIVSAFTAGETLAAGNPLYIVDYPSTTPTFDTSASYTTASGTTISQTFTVASNSNRLLLVVAACSNAQTITGATYNGVSLTKLVDNATIDSSQVYTFFYLLAPATGANTLVITGSASTTLNAHAYSYYNVAQAAPEANNAATAGSGTITATVTTLTARALVFGFTTSRGSGTTGSAFVNNTLTTNNLNSGDSGEVTPIGSKSISITADGSGFSSGAWVYSFATVASNAAQRVFKTSASQTTTSTPFIGFAQASATAGTSVNVATGGIEANQTGLTTGVPYYLSNTTAAIATSAGSQTKKVGIATSPTTLLITNVW